MLQSHTSTMLPSPARFGLSASSPSLPPNPNPNPKLQPPPPSSSHSNPKSTAGVVGVGVSPALLPLLPPLPRAQSILLQMANLASKLFDASPNRALWLSSFRGSLPSFIPSSAPQPHPPSSAAAAPSTSKEILSLFSSLQSQLLESVAELQEILDLQDSRLKLVRDIRPLDSNLLSFTKKIKESEQVLDRLLDDYGDYLRRPPSKRPCGSDDSSPLRSALDVDGVLSYAHRLSYTTYAPPEHGGGLPLPRWSLPPAPQEDQMRASMLYHFADMDVGVPKKPAAEPKDKASAAVARLDDAPLMEPTPPREDLLPAGVHIPPPMLPINVPAGWRKGMPVELPMDFQLPPGWKPGDPVVLPPLDGFSADRRREEPRPGVPAPKATEQIQVAPVQLDINPDDIDDDSSGYSSGMGSSEDDED